MNESKYIFEDFETLFPDGQKHSESRFPRNIVEADFGVYVMDSDRCKSSLIMSNLPHIELVGT